MSITNQVAHYLILSNYIDDVLNLGKAVAEGFSAERVVRRCRKNLCPENSPATNSQINTQNHKDAHNHAYLQEI
jgi:hypothetical protein